MNTIIARGDILKRIRIKKGLSIRGLAKITHLNPVTIQKIELLRSKPNPSTALRICDALGVEFDVIFDIKKRG